MSLISTQLMAQPCASNASTITLLSQSDVDSFQATYGPCDSVTGILAIGTFANPSSNINDLTPLSGLKQTTQLIIVDNDSLLSLNGLQNLQQQVISRLSLVGNLQLNDISQLSGIGPVGGDVGIVDNPALTSLEGLQNLKTFGTAFSIRNMPGLTSLDPMCGITSIARALAIVDNDALTDITAFEDLESFGGAPSDIFQLKDNDVLSDCSPLCHFFQVVFPQNDTETVEIQNNLTTCLDLPAILADCVGQNGGIYNGSGTTPSMTQVDVTDNLTFGQTTLVIDELNAKVGIGTATPTYELDIIGDVGISGAIFGLSDERLKKNQAPLTNALSIIAQLDPAMFQFKSDEHPKLNLPTSDQYGLMAQEVEKVLPELVSTMKTPDGQVYKTVNYNALIAILVAGIQELQEFKN